MRLLLDEHFPSAVVASLRREGVDVTAVQEWLEGALRSSTDDRLLAAAQAESRVLVSYDRKTLPTLLKDWARMGRHHAGVILIADKTVRQNDVGGLVRALRSLIARAGDWDWQDRVMFLQPP